MDRQPWDEPDVGSPPLSLRRTLGMPMGGLGSSRLARWRRGAAWPAALSLTAVALLAGYQGLAGALPERGVSTSITPPVTAPVSTSDSVPPAAPVVPTPTAGTARPSDVPVQEGTPLPLPDPPAADPPTAEPQPAGGADAERHADDEAEEPDDDHSGHGGGGDDDDDNSGPGSGGSGSGSGRDD
ncbi:MAG: hypothetical protein H0T66_18015 [Geodermatophilaceae bacterium]|nr:hypothetical protein [Geodermatophilaceae bacterium]MDQ3456000.1 hypothetical protein [Actinomycetota bacterium]